MKIVVAHSTTYSYDSPVFLEPHIFRLRPRAYRAQNLLSFALDIYPMPLGTTECLDQDGNLAVNAWFNSPTRELRVTSNFTVEMFAANPFDYIISAEALHLPIHYPEPLATALGPYRAADSIASSVKEFSRKVGYGVRFNTLEYLLELSREINRTFRQIVRPDGPPWPSGQTLQTREGSCRDFAMLFCDCCRIKGLAARFVSGYECIPAPVDESYMHAWAEVYLPGIGWRGYDPSRGLAVTNQHIPVAAGFHHELAAPLSGWYSGNAVSKMETALKVELLP